MFKRCTPLDSRLAADGRSGADGRRQLRIGVRPPAELVQIGRHGGDQRALDGVIKSLAGHVLPSSPTRVQYLGTQRWYRIAPDQYWWLAPPAGSTERLTTELPAEIGSVTWLSDARSRIVMQGPAALAVLGKLVSTDMRPGTFPIGSFVQTGLHHVGALLEHFAPDNFEIHALSTYAATVWDVLTDAAWEYGYEINREL